MSATATREETLINTLADEFNKITGITKAYGFAKNPDTLNNADLPAVLFHPSGFAAELKFHHGGFRNEIDVTATLFVAQRMSKGGRLKFLENQTMPFLPAVRQHFQLEATIKALFNVGNLTKVTDFTGTYGAGGPFLTHNGVEYIGCIFRWKFTEMI